TRPRSRRPPSSTRRVRCITTSWSVLPMVGASPGSRPPRCGGRARRSVLGIALVGVIVWLLVANLLAWRARVLPRGQALLSIASGLTVQLLYPAWALGLGPVVGRRATG